MNKTLIAIMIPIGIAAFTAAVTWGSTRTVVADNKYKIESIEAREMQRAEDWGEIKGAVQSIQKSVKRIERRLDRE